MKEFFLLHFCAPERPAFERPEVEEGNLRDTEG